MSRGIKLVLMGVAGAAVLYSCAPAIGSGLGALPYLWFLSNPFYRPPAAAPCPPGTPSCDQQATRSGGSGGTGSSLTRGGSTADAPAATSTQSQRGGFGTTGSLSGSSGSS